MLVGSNVVWTFNVAHDGGTRIVKPLATFQVAEDYWGPQINNSAQVLYTGGVFTDDPRFTYTYNHQFAERPAVPLIDPAVGLFGAGVLAAGAAGATVTIAATDKMQIKSSGDAVDLATVRNGGELGLNIIGLNEGYPCNNGKECARGTVVVDFGQQVTNPKIKLGNLGGDVYSLGGVVRSSASTC